MKVQTFLNAIGAPEFFTGVPDSQLKPLCDYLMNTYGISERHIIAANEGNCVGIAAGYHLATGGVPLVYMQNSGIGNTVNPVASLLNDRVYAIPAVFVVGWRGEPGIKDEPQHIFQGEVTVKLLEDMDIAVFVLGKDTSVEELAEFAASTESRLASGKSVAYVVRKGALEYNERVEYRNACSMLREEIIRHITAVSGEDPIVSTTGKASRELFELREAAGQPHGYDFLTVGSMGHSSSIALGVALNKPDRRVWCIDGDGAALMHMGSLAVIGSFAPKNLIHVVINNRVHETVGGMPTVASTAKLSEVARACGYKKIFRADSLEELDSVLKEAAEAGELSFIEASAAIGSRADLGRPTTTALENKINFMNNLKESK